MKRRRKDNFGADVTGEYDYYEDSKEGKHKSSENKSCTKDVCPYHMPEWKGGNLYLVDTAGFEDERAHDDSKIAWTNKVSILKTMEACKSFCIVYIIEWGNIMTTNRAVHKWLEAFTRVVDDLDKVTENITFFVTKPTKTVTDRDILAKMKLLVTLNFRNEKVRKLVERFEQIATEVVKKNEGGKIANSRKLILDPEQHQEDRYRMYWHTIKDTCKFTTKEKSGIKVTIALEDNEINDLIDAVRERKSSYE